ncbi:MAG: hypothetical protein JWM06_3506 [Actinomycetia bacterium]|jgi:uncharacterized membrane protein HdeD (DUF308 family)|nr:hypothetical protein [Actinomycetes bacterium]
MTTATPTTVRLGRATRGATRHWWLFLVSGLGWLLFAVILFRFDYLTVGAISILFGVGAFVAAGNEFALTSLVSGGWKIAHAVLGVVYVVAGVVALVNPGGTFVALAAVMSVVLVVIGAFDLTAAIMTRATAPAWWLQLVAGVAEILLGFWAAGSWNLSAVLLVAWVAAFALTRGITQIALAVGLWEARRLAAA